MEKSTNMHVCTVISNLGNFVFTKYKTTCGRIKLKGMTCCRDFGGEQKSQATMGSFLSEFHNSVPEDFSDILYQSTTVSISDTSFDTLSINDTSDSHNKLNIAQYQSLLKNQLCACHDDSFNWCFVNRINEDAVKTKSSKGFQFGFISHGGLSFNKNGKLGTPVTEVQSLHYNHY